MKDLKAKLERLIRLAAPDTMTLELEDGQELVLAEEDTLNALVGLLSALRNNEDPWGSETLAIIEKAVPGQHPMIDLIKALLVHTKMHQEGEHFEDTDV